MSTPLSATNASSNQERLRIRRLDEQQRCWYVEVEYSHIGVGGDRLLAQIMDQDVKVIPRGRPELVGVLLERPEQRVRLQGRLRSEKIWRM